MKGNGLAEWFDGGKNNINHIIWLKQSLDFSPFEHQ